jgi:ribonuclease-3
MAISNHEQVDRALTLLGQGLYPYVEREMQAVYRNRWLTAAKSCLTEDYTLKRGIEKTLREEVYALLKVMSKQWEEVFKKNQNLGYPERALVNELIEVRHKWAHKSTFSTDDTYRALDSIARLLKAVSASEEADSVEKHKQEVLRIVFREQIRYETRPTASVSIAEEARLRERLDEILKKLPFQDASLLQRALTHRSYIYENPNSGEDNERLEFLGDAILTFLSGEYLYRSYPEMREGEMTPLRSRLVDKPQLAKFATDLEIGRCIRLGKGAEIEGGRTNSSLLSNTFEAIIGAYFLDSGVEAVRNFVEPLFTEAIKNPAFPEFNADSNNFVDSKGRFQKWALGNIDENPQRQVPKYITSRSGGADNAPEFIAKVFVGEKEYGEGRGRSRKDAEKCAAEDALAKLKRRGLL